MYTICGHASEFSVYKLQCYYLSNTRSALAVILAPLFLISDTFSSPRRRQRRAGEMT